MTRAYAELRERDYAESRRRVGHGHATAPEAPDGPRPGLRPVGAGRRRHRPQLRGSQRPERCGRRVRGSGRRAAGLPLQPRLLPGRAPPAPGGHRRAVRRARAADCPRAGHGHGGGARRRGDRGPGAHRPGRPGRRRGPRLPQRHPGALPPQRAARPGTGRPRGVGPRCHRGDRPAGGASPGLLDPRLPEPHRARHERVPARGVRRLPPACPRGPRGRRGAPGAGSRRPGHARALRGARSRTRSPSAAPASSSGEDCAWAGSARPRR